MLKNPGKKLRELMAGPDILIAPGVFNGFSAGIVNQSGFPMAWGTGGGASASILGLPDIGLATMSEIVTNAARMANVMDIPILHDADTGYGNALNVIRTVHEFERAGVAGVMLEDQITPKKCGYLNGKFLVTPEEFEAKLKAAVNERYDSDFVIGARTDANSVEGFDKAMDRCRRYIDAGVDILFFEAQESIEQLEKVGKEFGDKVALLGHMSHGGKTPSVTNKELEQMGYKIIIYSGVTVHSQVYGMIKALEYLKEHGTDAGVEKTPIDTYWKVTNHPYWKELEQKYSI